MQCCICGGEAKGKQWHNRDKGFGICSDCALEESNKLSNEEMESSYGILGLNYFISSKRTRIKKTRFVFQDDEGNTMLIENISYKKFRQMFDRLLDEVNNLEEGFDFFYEELETRFKKTYPNSSITGITLYDYHKD